MTRWRDILRLRLRSLFRGGDVDHDLARELDAHLAEQIEAHMTDGLSYGDARRRALLEFGPRASIEEACRDTRRIRFMTSVVQDLRYGWRAILRHPVLLLAASSSIALGVGANLAIFGLANHLLLSVPSASDPGRLVHIRTANGSHVSYPVWSALEASDVLAGVAGYQIEQQVTARVGTESATLTPLLVTANYFDVVGVPVSEGRGFTADEARASRRPHLVVVSHSFKTRWLAGTASVVGTVVTINGEPYTVLGVLPRDLRSLPGYGLAPDVYLPLSDAFIPGLEGRRDPVVQLVGRLRRNQSVVAGRDAVAAALGRIGDALGDDGAARLTVFAPVGGVSQLSEMRAVATFFLVLMVVAGLVLAIACANVAGLLIGRSATRQREIALRVSLGASRARLVQQFLTEGLLLAAAGTVTGLVLTGLLSVALARLRLPVPLPIDLEFGLDWRFAAVALVLVIVSTLASSLVPALRATRSLVPSLGSSDLGMARRGRLRRVLVGGQVAVSAVLVVTAMLFVRNLTQAQALRPGFDVDRVLVADVTFVEGTQGTPEAPRAAALAGVVERLPGVEAASYADGVPLTIESGSLNGTQMRIDGLPAPIRVDYAGNRVGPGYFAVMGIHVERGREFRPTDRAGRPPVAIVNDTFVRQYLNGQPALGRRIADLGRRDAVPAEIVGVVADSRYRTVGEAPIAAVYLPSAQVDRMSRRVHLLIRGTGPARPAVPAVRAALLAQDRSMAADVTTMDEALAFAFLPSRLGALLLGALGGIAVLLAVVGLFGVVSHAVSRRTAEIGIRVALGASRRSVLRLVLREGVRLVAGGVAVGLGLGLVMVRPLAAFLVAGLHPDDPASFAATLVLFVAVTLIAIAAPAARALSIQPAVALRDE